MVCKIKNTPEEQYRAEHKRFLARQRPKPVLCQKIASREARLLENKKNERTCDLE